GSTPQTTGTEGSTSVVSTNVQQTGSSANNPATNVQPEGDAGDLSKIALRLDRGGRRGSVPPRRDPAEGKAPIQRDPLQPNPYNGTITLRVGRPYEGIFRESGIADGATAAHNALQRAVDAGRDPRVMIVTGYSSGRRAPETGGPGGAAASGRALRLYAQQELGVDISVQYVVDRGHRKVMQAALEALGEKPGQYELVTFNARGRWADGRSRAFLDKHQPDLMMAFDLPGRTAGGRYRNSLGEDVTRYNSARDQLFLEARNRGDDITTLAAFDRGNEVGGGHAEIAPRVKPADDGTEIVTTVPVDVPMTGGRTNWVGYAFGTEMLRRAGALNRVPTEDQVAGMVRAMRDAGAKEHETSAGRAYESPEVEAAIAGMLKVRAQNVGEARYEVDLRGRRLRLGVFDSGSGGIIAAAEIKRVVEERTGAKVDIVAVVDHGAGTYGSKTKDSIAEHTNDGVLTLDRLGVHLKIMACNTACTSGKSRYAAGVDPDSVVDLISSTREFHRGVAQDLAPGERIAAFSTQATADLVLPAEVVLAERAMGLPTRMPPEGEAAQGSTSKGVYRDERTLPGGKTEEVVTPVGGTDPGFDLAKIVNEYMPRKDDPAMQQRMQDAADHYLDKILREVQNVKVISWNCTHYPEVQPFFAAALRKRGLEGKIRMVNPMEYQARKAIAVASQLPPGTGTGPSRAVAFTTAPETPTADIKVDVADVRRTMEVALQRPDVEVVRLDRFGNRTDVSEWRQWLDESPPVDPIDALLAYDPSGRGFPIHVPGGAGRAADRLADSSNVAVVTGFPVRTPSGFKYESDSTKGAATLAAALANLDKNVTCITPSANVAPLKAALHALGRDDIEVRTMDQRPGTRAAARRADRLVSRLDLDTVVSVETPGRDPSGRYWDSRGEDITPHVAALDEMFFAAQRRTDAHPDRPVQRIAILDLGNEAGGGNVDKRVRRTPDGQRIASVVTADEVVTAGIGSWGADATVAALELRTGRRDLLPTPEQVPRVISAITARGGVDGQSRTAIDDASGYSGNVHAGMNQLFRQAVDETAAARAAAQPGG
ncbi:MAG: glutamate cyclase domain-containing protein, partial [Pseudomonadota bacterium]